MRIGTAALERWTARRELASAGQGGGKGGVGRSGAFTTIYCMYRLVLEAREVGWEEVEEHLGPGEEVCLVGLVRRLRETRHPWMVEGAQQYKLAYATVLALLQGMFVVAFGAACVSITARALAPLWKS